MDAKAEETYTIKNINTTDAEMEAFLFRLGCYSDEDITVISKRKNGCICAFTAVTMASSVTTEITLIFFIIQFFKC